MIEICVDLEKRYVKISGHAEHAESGKDVVCAGVTAITGALINMVAERGDPDWVNFGPKEEISVRYPAEWPGLENCLEMALTGWRAIEEEYPENVRIVQPE